MKHNLKITAILVAMFIITQFLGLYVVNFYSTTKMVDGQEMNIADPHILPYGFESPEPQNQTEFNWLLGMVLMAFTFAILLLLFLSKINAAFILKAWFFIVIVIALGISLNAFLPSFGYKMLAIFLLTIPLAFVKIYRQNFLVHNFTELLVYPGIGVIFAKIFNIPTIIILLILISIYDMWAVWKSGIMQKMARYQIDNLKVFSGFFIPYVSKKVKLKIKKMKKSDLKKKGIKVNVAILGGGDVVFPIIIAGVVLKKFGFVTMFGMSVPLASILVILGATLGLGTLFLFSEKKKFYPAMPFITAGIFLGMGISYLIL